MERYPGFQARIDRQVDAIRRTEESENVLDRLVIKIKLRDRYRIGNRQYPSIIRDSAGSKLACNCRCTVLAGGAESLFVPAGIWGV